MTSGIIFEQTEMRDQPSSVLVIEGKQYCLYADSGYSERLYVQVSLQGANMPDTWRAQDTQIWSNHATLECIFKEISCTGLLYEAPSQHIDLIHWTLLPVWWYSRANTSAQPIDGDAIEPKYKNDIYFFNMRLKSWSFETSSYREIPYGHPS